MFTKRIAALLAVLALGAAAAAPRPAVAASAPAYTVTRYVSNPSTSTFYGDGCSAGKAATSGGPGVGIVILDFGQPVLSGSTYGTYDYGNHFDSIGTITAVAEAWLQGYWDCTPATNPPQVKLAVGTSNYLGATTYAHGQAWGAMVNTISSWIASRGYGSQLAARGANDMEVGWNSPTNTRAWVDGYNNTGQNPLYDYGDDAGGISPGNGWTAGDVWYVAYGAQQDWPVPEIYYTADAAQDWQPLSLWAYQNKGSAMTFLGTLTEYAVDPTTLTPSGGWNALYSALNSDGRTAQASLSYATDITWANSAEQTLAPAPKTPAIKPEHPTPPPAITPTAPVWGLLPADAGPVPLPSRLYKVENKWLGEVNGAFTGIYAGADAQHPQVGILAVFQPGGGGAPLQVYRTRTATGALRITQVSGGTVAFAHAGGQGSFDLATRQFGR